MHLHSGRQPEGGGSGNSLRREREVGVRGSFNSCFLIPVSSIGEPLSYRDSGALRVKYIPTCHGQADSGRRPVTTHTGMGRMPFGFSPGPSDSTRSDQCSGAMAPRRQACIWGHGLKRISHTSRPPAKSMSSSIDPVCRLKQNLQSPCDRQWRLVSGRRATRWNHLESENQHTRVPRPAFLAATLGADPAHRGSRSCGSRAWLLCSTWTLARPGIEPMSPSLAGGFLPTAPLGRPRDVLMFLFPASWSVR